MTHARSSTASGRPPLLLLALLWLVWLAVAVWLTGPGFVAQVEYFRSPGPRFFQILLILLAVSPVVLWTYHRLRRGWFWRWEFASVAAIPVGASFLYEFRGAAVTLSVVVGSFALGHWIRVHLGIPARGAVEDVAISTAVGLGVLHCALFLMGLAGWYNVPAFLMLIAAFMLAGSRELRQLWTSMRELHRAWETTSELRGWQGVLLSVFGAALAVCAVMVMLAPSVAFDVVRAHLPLVHYYATQHALRVPDWLNYGYFPQGVESLMTFGYVLAGDAAAQMLPAVYFVLALLIAFRIGRLCGLSVISALAGTLFAAAMPLVHWTGSVAKNDLALAFFLLAALHGYLSWRESGNFRSVLGGAFFLATGAGVKLSVVYAIPPLAVLFAQTAFRQQAPIRAMAKLAAIFLLFGTYWQLRTWVQTGNPMYPMAPAVAISTGTGNVATRLARLPWDIHFHGRGYFESPLDQPLGIVLVLFTPLWALAKKRVNRMEAVCLFFCGVYLVYWGVVHGMPRFAIAPIMILTVLTAARVIDFCRKMRQAVKVTIYTASAYALLFGLLGVAIVEINAPQLRYFAGRIGKAGYLREAMVPYRSIEFLKGIVGPGEAILSLDNCPLAYAPNPSLFHCLWQAESAPDAIRAEAARRDYGFLILPVARADLAEARWRKVYADESYEIYQNNRTQ